MAQRRCLPLAPSASSAMGGECSPVPWSKRRPRVRSVYGPIGGVQGEAGPKPGRRGCGPVLQVKALAHLVHGDRYIEDRRSEVRGVDAHHHTAQVHPRWGTPHRLAVNSWGKAGHRRPAQVDVPEWWVPVIGAMAPSTLRPGMHLTRTRGLMDSWTHGLMDSWTRVARVARRRPMRCGHSPSFPHSPRDSASWSTDAPT